MNTSGDTAGPHKHPTGSTTGFGAGTRMVNVLLWVVGVVAAILGLLILLGSDNQHVGLGGDLSWRAGDVHPAWGYGLAAAGLVALVGAVLLTARLRTAPKIETGESTAFLIHAGIFAVVNAVLWLQDIALGDGLSYAYLVTIPWGVGLLSHAVVCLTRRGRS